MTPITSLGHDTAEQPGMAYRRGIANCELSTETVADVLYRVGHDCPDNRALAWLTDDGLEALAWGEVYLRAKSVAASLVIQNPGRARIGFVAPNSVDWLVAPWPACGSSP